MSIYFRLATRPSSSNFSTRHESSTSSRDRIKTNITPDSFRSEQTQIIDLGEIEIVDLTEPAAPSRPPRRRSYSPASERPAKRFKGKEPEIIISIDDNEPSPSPSPTASPPNPLKRNKSAESGLLSQAKCVICLESPTDLVATPCGMTSHAIKLMVGHLFCDFCIRSALHTVGRPDERQRPVMTATTGNCPICRRKISTRNLINMEIKVRKNGKENA